MLLSYSGLHIEQMTMMVRYVDVIKPSHNEKSETEVPIREHLLGFVALKETIDAFMLETLLGQVEQMGLPTENLPGQGYDNGSNMKGKKMLQETGRNRGQVGSRRCVCLAASSFLQFLFLLAHTCPSLLPMVSSQL